MNNYVEDGAGGHRATAEQLAEAERRAAQTVDSKAGRPALAEELRQMGLEVLPRLVHEYLAIRDEDNANKKRRTAVHDRLLPLLEDAGGSYIDEAAGVRIYIERIPRWEYDKHALYAALVEDGDTPAELFEQWLVVDKAKVQEAIDKGLVYDRQVQRANAKVGTKIVQSIRVEPLHPGTVDV